MNKELKKKIIVSVISVVIGISILICTFIFKNIFTEENISYATGFSSGLIIVGMIIFIRTIFAISGVDKGKKMVDTLQDERLIAINNEASEITFRIITIIESITCILLFFFGMEKEGTVLSVFVGISLLVYLITYFVLSKKK